MAPIEHSQERLPPKTLLFGATSMVGSALARLYPESLLPFAPSARQRRWPPLQLESSQWLTDLFHEHSPDLLIYCHAVCDVSKCEAAPVWAQQINVDHIRRVLSALPDSTRLVYVSSDHVFGGDGTYCEESDPCPISVYGRTRVEAEDLVRCREDSLVVRCPLAIGASHDGRTGHLDWLAYRHQRDLPITIIEDEYRSAVRLDDLAERVLQLATANITGLRHVAATRAVSRVELARHLAGQLGIDPVFKIQSRFDQPAPHLGRVELATIHDGELSQPLSSVLDCSKGQI